ncbi:MAG TPA: FAD-dependent oxidoreductase [Candidatus Omnitrophota bacterium]|nr:FAD-dependent oxidoreductase [Candidatus Omnitrophota bacterium]
MRKVLVLGGGLGGLSVAWMLSRTGRFQVTVVEKEPSVGGLCSTFRHGDFSLDYGAHKVYSVIPGILDEFLGLMGEEVIKHKKKNSIFLFGKYLDYPVNILDLMFKMGLKNLALCSINMLQAIISKIGAHHSDDSYEDFVINKFGHRLYSLVFKPLAEKVWGDPQSLSVDIAKTRIPSASIFDVLAMALGFKKKAANKDAQFFYYPKGGFGRISERMCEEIKKHSGVVLVNTAVECLGLERNHIVKAVLKSNGKQEIIKTDLVISSIHLDALVGLFPGDSEIRQDRFLDLVNRLEYRSLILVYLFLDKEKIINDHWIFFPDSNLIFSRIFEQKNMDFNMAPKDRTVICCDFTDYGDGRLSREEDSALAQRCISQLEDIGLINSGWVRDRLVKRFAKFYPRYNLNYKFNLRLIYKELQQFDNLLLTGRIGFYNYNNADHCLDMGKFIADRLIENKDFSLIWQELEKRVSEYRIVD